MCRCVRYTDVERDNVVYCKTNKIIIDPIDVVNISVHICLHARYRRCICAHVCAVCTYCNLVLGNEDGGVQLVHESTCCLT